MAQQSYATHRRYVPLYHFVLSTLIAAGLGGALVNLSHSIEDPHRYYNAALIALVFLCLGLVFFYAREFALRAQDRAIRAEEALRHYVTTGQPLDARLSMRQVIGLRFAGDDEFAALARRAVEEELSPDAIKRAVKSWRADHDRV
jgi:Family of unknown function (DUF6526)